MFVSKALRVFVILYQEGSIKRASEKLNLTIPPVYRMMKKVEDWFGCVLFLLEGGRLTPTKFADYLYNNVIVAYQNLNQIKGNGVNPNLVISSPHSASTIINDFAFLMHGKKSIATLEFSEKIRPQDDFFISFNEGSGSITHQKKQIQTIIRLYSHKRFTGDCYSLNVLIDSTILNHQGFGHVVDKMKNDGFRGSFIVIDNPYLHHLTMMEYDFLTFKIQNCSVEKMNPLSFYYTQPLFIYQKKDISSNIININNNASPLSDNKKHPYIRDGLENN